MDFDYNEIKNIIKERDEALLSLDKEKILAYCQKYELSIPENEEAFWAAVHKAIVHMNAATSKQKLNSTIWLYSHGFNLRFE